MIIDSFIFSNELDMLELRLGILYPYVDKFVIVESLEYHGSANKKPSTILTNWHRLKLWEDKIVFRMLPLLNPPYTDHPDSWPRENFHRNALMTPILETYQHQNDIVLISDCDEIPNPNLMIGKFTEKTCSFTQDFFYYNVNTYKGTWNGTVATSVGLLMQSNPQYFRDRRDHWPIKVGGGGWHFSYFGGVDKIENKVANFAHSNDGYCKELLQRTHAELIEDIRNGRDLFRRKHEDAKEMRSSQDPRLPKYFLENHDKFKQFTREGMGLL